MTSAWKARGCDGSSARPYRPTVDHAPLDAAFHIGHTRNGFALLRQVLLRGPRPAQPWLLAQGPLLIKGSAPRRRVQTDTAADSLDLPAKAHPYGSVPASHVQNDGQMTVNRS